jgi:hypothetical protein
MSELAPPPMPDKPVIINIAKHAEKEQKELDADKPYEVKTDNNGFPFFCKYCFTGAFTEQVFNIHCNTSEHQKFAGTYYLYNKK